MPENVDSNDKLRLGLIGAGYMANHHHYPSLAAFDDVELVALCDLVTDKLTATAEQFGIKQRYTDYREMISKESLDAVFVLMPPHHVFDVVIDCLHADLHVFIEKPPAITTFQVESFCREAYERELIGMVGFNRRYMPMLTHARRRMFEACYVNQVVAKYYKNESAVYYNGAVDVIGCDAIHAVDTLLWLAGSSVRDVVSVVSINEDVVPNAWQALVSFENGVVGILSTNWATAERHHSFEIHGRGASAFLTPDKGGTIVVGDQREQFSAAEIAGSDDDRIMGGFQEQARHFIDCIRAGVEPRSSFDRALETMQLVDAIRSNQITSPTQTFEEIF